MKLKHKFSNDVAVVTIEGKLVGGPENSKKFHSLFRSLIEVGHPRIVVDLGRTSWANSQGIGMLIGAYTSARKAGGDLVLARVLDRISGILSVTRLYLIFRVFDTQAAAITHLSAQLDPTAGKLPVAGEDAPGDMMTRKPI